MATLCSAFRYCRSLSSCRTEEDSGQRHLTIIAADYFLRTYRPPSARDGRRFGFADQQILSYLYTMLGSSDLAVSSGSDHWLRSTCPVAVARKAMRRNEELGVYERNEEYALVLGATTYHPIFH